MAKGRKTGGRKVGSLNRVTGAQQDLLDAWDKVSGPVTALNLMKAAIDEALGRECDILDAKGMPTGKKKKGQRNFEPFRGLLPYIARKMPESTEVGVTDGGSITIKIVKFSGEEKAE